MKWIRSNGLSLLCRSSPPRPSAKNMKLLWATAMNQQQQNKQVKNKQTYKQTNKQIKSTHFIPECVSNSVMKVDKVFFVQVENIPKVEVQIPIFENVAHQFLLIGFLWGLVDHHISILCHSIWYFGQEQPCLPYKTEECPWWTWAKWRINLRRLTHWLSLSYPFLLLLFCFPLLFVSIVFLPYHPFAFLSIILFTHYYYLR